MSNPLLGSQFPSANRKTFAAVPAPTSSQIVGSIYGSAKPYTGQTLMGANYGKYKGGVRHKKRKTMRQKSHRRKGKSRKH
jgi:hypothetical protein